MKKWNLIPLLCAIQLINITPLRAAGHHETIRGLDGLVREYPYACLLGVAAVAGGVGAGTAYWMAKAKSRIEMCDAIEEMRPKPRVSLRERIYAIMLVRLQDVIKNMQEMDNRHAVVGCVFEYPEDVSFLVKCIGITITDKTNSNERDQFEWIESESNLEISDIFETLNDADQKTAYYLLKSLFDPKTVFFVNDIERRLCVFRGQPEAVQLLHDIFFNNKE